MRFSIADLFWVFFAVSVLWPAFAKRRLDAARLAKIRELEAKRGTRVIVLVHRQESLSVFGIPIARFIDINDSEEILRVIRLTPPGLPIDIILHTPGGLVLATEQIARALKNHPAKVTAIIPHYAMSGGTMIALAANEITMDDNAVLGPVDPQLGEFPAASILRVLDQKRIEDIDDRTLILADIARKGMAQVEVFLRDILSEKFPAEETGRVAGLFAHGHWTHDYPITCAHLRAFGLPVTTDVPTEVYELMELYPQAPSRRPSVQYIPVPYHREDRPPGSPGTGPKGGASKGYMRP
jgi:ClpP class serine protease